MNTTQQSKLASLSAAHGKTTDGEGSRWKKPHAYIAGPMRGIEKFNFPAFQEAEDELHDAGWIVRSPHRNPVKPLLDGTERPLKEYMVADLSWVAASDALFMLDGWLYSEGARLEYNVATYLDIPVYEINSGLEIAGVEVYTMDEEIVGAADRDVRTRAAVVTFKDNLLGAGEVRGHSRHPASARFHEILHELGSLHDRKQADYGTGTDPFANVRSSSDFGMPAWVGCMVRANDKMKRLQKFALTRELVNESVLDSFDDLAVYAIIGRVLFEEDNGEAEDA